MNSFLTQLCPPQDTTLARCEPPRGWSPVTSLGEVKLVEHDFATSQLSASQRAGRLYERHFHKFARRQWGQHYRTFKGQYFSFHPRHKAHQKRRFCQPDGLYVKQGHIIIFEVKLSHTSQAWYQLTELYLPVLTKYFSGAKSIKLVEVCKFFDPAVAFPCEVEHLFPEDIEAFSTTPKTDKIGVMKWVK